MADRRHPEEFTSEYGEPSLKLPGSSKREETWIFNGNDGKPRAGDRPGAVEFSVNYSWHDATFIKETYYSNDGKTLCDNTRTTVIEKCDGDMVNAYWYNKAGALHREGNRPAKITYGNGYTINQYYTNGTTRNNDRPSFEIIDTKTGKLKKQIWYNDKGLQHRKASDGPASIVYDPTTGEIAETTYSENGRNVPNPN